MRCCVELPAHRGGGCRDTKKGHAGSFPDMPWLCCKGRLSFKAYAIRRAKARGVAIAPLSRRGTYPSLVRRSRYVFSQAGLLASLHRLEPLLSLRQWSWLSAPRHSSGPVGDFHSVPFSPVPIPKDAPTPANTRIFTFPKGILIFL